MRRSRAPEKSSIERGATLVKGSSLGCASCHVATLTLDDPIFSEPSQSATHRDARFPAGQNPLSLRRRSCARRSSSI